MNKLFFIISSIFFLFSLSSLVSGQVTFSMDVDEGGKVIQYYDEYYVVQVTGTVSITNNLNVSMYSLVVPYTLDTLALFETSDTDYIDVGQLSFISFDPRETKIFDYEIRGITATNPVKKNYSVFRSMFVDSLATVNPLLITSIKKSEVEQADINTSKIVGVANRRLVTMTVQNPSTAIYNITKAHILKTPDLNPNNIINRWEFPADAPYKMMRANEIWVEDIIDYNASPADVYWLNLEMDDEISFEHDGSHSVLFFDQDDLFNPENLTIEELEELGNVTDYLEHMMYVKKSYSKTHMMFGDIVEVDIRVNNFAPISRNLTITDKIPLGFEFVEESNNDATLIDGNQLIWNLAVNPDSSKTVKYEIKYVDEELLGIDYFDPAVVEYGNKTLYTTRTPFVRKYVPEKKIFIQKKIRSSLNDEYVVELQIKNLGESKVSDVYVKEFLKSTDTFREITQIPEEKGLWVIPELKTDEVWEVSYVTNNNEALTALPEVFGVDKNIVLKTLVFENVIKSGLRISDLPFLNKYGVFIVIGIIGSAIFANHVRRNYKERTLKKMGKKISKLRDETMPNFNDNIAYLKKESSKGLNLPNNNMDFGNLKGASSGGHTGPVNHHSKAETRHEAENNLEQLKKLSEDVSQPNVGDKK